MTSTICFRSSPATYRLLHVIFPMGHRRRSASNRQWKACDAVQNSPPSFCRSHVSNRLPPKVINLCNLLTNTTDILHSAIGEGVALETSFASDLWNTSVDPSNMENAVLNLAINARDAMDGKGELRIDVSNIELDEAFTQLYPDVTPGQYVMLTVSDTGSGMSPDIIDKIFEPFF
ncbi:MAG: hypothetical protein E8G75_06330, partial [Sulfitobacter sp. SK025]